MRKIWSPEITGNRCSRNNNKIAKITQRNLGKYLITIIHYTHTFCFLVNKLKIFAHLHLAFDFDRKENIMLHIINYLLPITQSKAWTKINFLE